MSKPDKKIEPDKKQIFTQKQVSVQEVGSHLTEIDTKTVVKRNNLVKNGGVKTTQSSNILVDSQTKLSAEPPNADWWTEQNVTNNQYLLLYYIITVNIDRMTNDVTSPLWWTHLLRWWWRLNVEGVVGLFLLSGFSSLCETLGENNINYITCIHLLKGFGHISHWC